MSYSAALIEHLRDRATEDNRIRMEAYMRNKFQFLGVRSEDRKHCLKKHLAIYGIPESNLIESAIREMWNAGYREMQYCAQELFYRSKHWKESGSIALIEWLIQKDSWWDTVDYLAAGVCGSYFKANPVEIQHIIPQWNASEDLWLVRSSLLFQLKYREKTDLDLLEKTIIPHLDEQDFFIRKAIGWALRQVSKHNPSFVRGFIQCHTLQPLSLKEATKYVSY